MSAEGLRTLPGQGRAKRGIFEGDLEEGELEIGQVSLRIKVVKPASRIVEDIWNDFNLYRGKFYSGTQTSL